MLILYYSIIFILSSILNEVNGHHYINFCLNQDKSSNSIVIICADANSETDNDVPDIGDAEESMHSEVDAQVSVSYTIV